MTRIYTADQEQILCSNPKMKKLKKEYKAVVDKIKEVKTLRSKGETVYQGQQIDFFIEDMERQHKDEHYRLRKLEAELLGLPFLLF